MKSVLALAPCCWSFKHIFMSAFLNRASARQVTLLWQFGRLRLTIINCPVWIVVVVVIIVFAVICLELSLWYNL